MAWEQITWVIQTYKAVHIKKQNSIMVWQQYNTLVYQWLQMKRNDDFELSNYVEKLHTVPLYLSGLDSWYGNLEYKVKLDSTFIDIF